MIQSEDFNKFADKFIDDAHNLLNELEGKLLELEKDTSNQELIEAVFRAMHTLKGIGSMFGFKAISEYTHHLETIYDKIREGIVVIDTPIFELTFASVDHLRNLLADQYIKNPAIAARHSSLSLQLEKLAISKLAFNSGEVKTNIDASGKKVDIKPATWYIQFVCSEELIKRAVNIAFIFEDLSKIGSYSIFNHPPKILFEDTHEELWGILLTTKARRAEIEEVFIFILENVRIVKLGDIDFSQTSQEKNAQTTSIKEIAELLGNEMVKSDDIPQFEPAKLNIEQEVIKASHKIPRISVGADKLDKLMYLVSELFTTRSELVTASSQSDMVRMKLAVEKIDKLSAQFRSNALSIRLVPLRELTLKFKRLIRDLSNQLGKNIDFEVQGDETELDKNLVDNLADPFMHIIRNCIDHGIEVPEIRNAKNKSVNGKISFKAYQSGNYIFVEISDDGNGIDKEYIRQKAVEKGFIQPNDQLSDKELLELIFLPGFSTAKNLTQVSGRGVGMDVVKRTITALRGSVDISSEKEKGTTFTFKLQQTITIMDTLLIRTGNSYFTILLEEVEVCELENHQTLYQLQNNHLQIAGDLIPFLSLRNAFSIRGDAPEIERIIVIKRQNLRYAIIIDSIIGQYQAVIKPLSTLIKHKQFLSGACIMGDGNIAFMLDTLRLSEIIK